MLEAPMPDVNLMLNLNAPTWFLPALFIVLIAGDGLFRLLGGQKKKISLFVALFAFVMLLYHYLSPFLLPWGLDILPYLLVFFFVGYEWKAQGYFTKLEECSGWCRLLTILGTLIVLIVSGLFNSSFNLSISYFGKSVAFCLISAVSSTFLLLFILRKLEQNLPNITKGIGSLGKYTLTILCYHYFILQMFFTAVSVIRPNIWDENGIVQAGIKLLGIVLSVVLCILLDWSRDKIMSKLQRGMK
jgi:hypothetical protein